MEPANTSSKVLTADMSETLIIINSMARASSSSKTEIHIPGAGNKEINKEWVSIYMQVAISTCANGRMIR